MSKEEVIERYISLAKKLDKTPSTNDMKHERLKDTEFPSIYWIKKYFKSSNRLAKKCGLVANQRNPMYLKEGNIKTLRLYLRSHTFKWKEETVKHWNGLSCISGKKYDVVHHDYLFTNIISDIFKITKYNRSNNVDDFTEEQLLNMCNLCEKLHTKYGIGYCLTNAEHKELHSIYGNNGSHLKMKEFIEYKNNNGKITKPLSCDDIVNNSEIIIFKHEIDLMLSLPTYKCQNVFLLFLIYSKIFKNIKDEFYLTYGQLNKYFDKRTFVKHRRYLEEKNILHTEQIRNGMMKKNIYKLNIKSNLDDDFIILKINDDLKELYFHCILKFYKTKKNIKMILNDSVYRKYSHSQYPETRVI